MRRLALVAFPSLGLVGLVFFIVVAAPAYLEIQHFPTVPDQPIYFDHELHVQQAGIECEFCHRTVNQGVTAGLPDVQQCMACHIVVGEGQRPEALQRLRRTWVAQSPIDWHRVHLIPDHTRFQHAPHMQAGVACESCHGQVEEMSRVQQVRSLKMSDCVDCHRDARATDQCVACHY